jgi:hypothetical protein
VFLAAHGWASKPAEERNLRLKINIKDYVAFCPRRRHDRWRLNHMTDQNLNFWGELVVPVGLLICFGVALVVWLRDELRAEPEDDGTKKPR